MQVVEFLSRRSDLSLISIMAQTFSFPSMHESLVIVSNTWGPFFHGLRTEGTNIFSEYFHFSRTTTVVFNLEIQFTCVLEP